MKTYDWVFEWTDQIVKSYDRIQDNVFTNSHLFACGFSFQNFQLKKT